MPESILLFRYLSADSALRAIEARRLRVGRVLEFNDPFEWRPGISGINPDGAIIADACLDAAMHDLNSCFGVICFSDLVSDPVLWSHYADHHRGVAFECDYSITDSLYRVAYTDDRPVIDVRRLNDPQGPDEELRALVNRMLAQKASSWSYEREYRVNVSLAECETGGGHYFKRIPDDFLTRVILGYRCQMEEAYIRKALDRVGLDKVGVIRAEMDRMTYRIKC